MPWLIVWKSERMKMFSGLSVARRSPRSAVTRTDISRDFVFQFLWNFSANRQTHDLRNNSTDMRWNLRRCIDSLHLWFYAKTPFLSQIQQREENFKEEEEKEGWVALSAPSHKDFTVLCGHIMNWMWPYRCPCALNVFPRPFTNPLKPLVCDPWPDRPQEVWVMAGLSIRFRVTNRLALFCDVS